MCRENLIDFSNYEIGEDGSIFSKHYHRLCKGTVFTNGYLQVKMMCKDGIRRLFLLHRVIWFYFNGEIPDGMQINHIDENKLNNSKVNLNLLSPKGNSNWGTRNDRITEARKNDQRFSSKITRIDPISGEIKEYPSIREAGRDGFNRGCIKRCIDGIQEQSMGFKWKYSSTFN